MLHVLLRILRLQRSSTRGTLIIEVFSVGRAGVSAESVLRRPRFVFSEVEAGLMVRVISNSSVSLLNSERRARYVDAGLGDLLRLENYDRGRFAVISVHLSFYRVDDVSSQVLRVPGEDAYAVLVARDVRDLRRLDLVRLLLAASRPVVFRADGNSASARM